MSKPRILTWDCETSPHEGYHWGLWQQNIAINQLKVPTRMLSFAAKFLGERKVHYHDIYSPDMLGELVALVDKADALVTFNGDKFDQKHLNRELVTAGLPPTRPVPSIDLLKVVKSRFNFPSNRLEYVAGVLLGESKLETGGFSLWPQFMAGDPTARKVMRKYNIQDVVVEEHLYERLRPWIKSHPNVTSRKEPDDADRIYACPACGSECQDRIRPRYTRCFAIRVLRCLDCGHVHEGQRSKL